MDVQRTKTASLLALFVLALAVMGGPADAQDNETWRDSDSKARVYAVVPVQGRLADSSGTPLDGSFTVTFRFYDGTGLLLCEDDDLLTVENGLFNAEVDFCGSADFNGQSVKMGVEVGTDGEMTPRLTVYPVPYAFSLRPTAQIIDSTSLALLHIENSGTSGRGLRAYATDDASVNYGIVGATNSATGFGGYFYNTEAGGVALRGFNDAADGGNGVEGESQGDDGVRGTSHSVDGAGVFGYNDGAGSAITGYSNSSLSLYPTLQLVQANAAGDFVVGASSLWGTRYFRVDRTGKGFFNGGTQTSGADFAERLDVVGEESAYEPGDVLVISQAVDRAVELATKPYSTAVMGVYSTEPGVLAGAPDTGVDLGGVPVAITGIVPCKVSGENGEIKRGDLLVTSSRVGHAMRAGVNPPAGTVVGKALQPFEGENGVIQIFVAAR